MPELPEVEHVVRALQTIVAGKVIARAQLLRERLAPDTKPASFARNLRGAKINFVHRRGKHILFDLDNRFTLIVHLRMSGRFSLLAAETENPKFTHAIFHFKDANRLVFDDQRHFGLMKIVKTGELHETNELKKLAPEPFSDDFSFDYLHAKLRGSKRNLKEFLIDQTKVCGLGNIYVCETMFAAGVDPRKQACNLSKQSVSKLHESIRAVLDLAINHGDGREVDPENLEANYFSGGGNDGWLVYDRENEPCHNCNKPIVRLKQGSRSTYYCSKCQRK